VIEGAVQQLQELKEVTSVSRMGSSQVKVEIDMRFARTRDELEQVWDKLRRKVADAQRQLPPGAGPSVVNDDFGDVFALFFAVTGEGYSLQQIHDYVDGCSASCCWSRRGQGRHAGRAARGDLRRDRRRPRAQLGIPLERIYQALQQQNVITAAGDAAPARSASR
jgi:multidrug efflux pump subunit AcrB